LSGVGPADLLRDRGIAVVQDSPGVGRNMREHFLLMLQYQVRRARDSHNRQFAGLPLVGNMLKYMLVRRGVMALGSYEVGAFAKVMPNAT
ncbi:hypothetical protein ABTO85_19585, partial [Acinetobacter baumannii]